MPINRSTITMSVLPNLETAAPEIAAIGNPIGAISQTVENVIRDALSADAKAVAARKVATGQRNKAYSVREAIMLAIAAASALRGWTDAEIEAGVEAGATAHTTREGKAAMKAASLKPLKSLMKHAARCRAEAKTLHATSERLWGAEAEVEDGEKPIKTAYKREIFFFDRLLQDHLAALPLSDDAIIDRARENDPKFDAKLAARKIKSMVAAMRAVHAFFPIDDIALAATAFEGITEKELRAAWERRATDTASAQVVPEPEDDDAAPVDINDAIDALGDISRQAA
jgi:hypothetical protein